MSKEHYNNRLLKKYCLLPLKVLVNQAKENTERGEKHFHGVILKKVFSEWLLYTRKSTSEKKKLADAKYEEILLRRSLASWKKVNGVMIDESPTFYSVKFLILF